MRYFLLDIYIKEIIERYLNTDILLRNEWAVKDSELESITGIISLWLHWGDKYLKTEIKSTEKSQVLIVDMIL